MANEWRWVPNIHCNINDGKASLDAAETSKRRCNGICSSCSSFRGVDITTIGQRTLDGCCAIIS